MNNVDLPKEYLIDIEKAVSILKKYGCKEIYLFGSLANKNFEIKSDIDIAVIGLEQGKYIQALSELYFELNHNIDLIKIDDDNNRFSKFLEEEEEMIRVA